MAGKAWRTFSLLGTAADLGNAWRLAAYADVGEIIFNEIIVEIASGGIDAAIPTLDGTNFELQKTANNFLASPDFTNFLPHDPNLLTPIGMLSDKWSFIDREIETPGGPLADMVIPCLSRAMSAAASANRILSYPETLRPRGRFTLDQPTTFLDRVNTGLGFAIWRPVPLVGVGSRQISNLTSYSGIFRRETAEGYGRITWTNGDIYIGQVRNGWERGYGVKTFSDGRVFVGFHNDLYLALGASISAKKDRIFAGSHERGYLTGYGRQIGIRNGVDSFTAFWDDRGPGDRIPFRPDTYAEIARNFTGRPFLAAEAEKYRLLARDGVAKSQSIDTDIVSEVNSYL